MKLTNLVYLSRGKRSNVYTTIYKKKKVAVKYSHRAEIEAYWLKKLSKLNFIPKLISSDNKRIIYEFIEGETIDKYLENSKNPILILKQILKQCYELDKLKINKKELTNPYKHILIKNKKSKMIDFERCYETDNPKNVTQFCEYLMRKKIINRKNLTPLLKNYKKNKTKKNFEKILRFNTQH
ncbi:hypothetical protein J4442_05195 [Candidatus Woesearchaeota archaeon]|nr:hypothetical protein [Candidatus Woesearchaeota archaeon]